MKITLLSLLFFFCLFLFQNSDAQVLAPQIDVLDIPDGQILKKEDYSDKALYGYIDGGADLYLEYGFKNAIVYEIQYHGRNFKIEIYQMKNDENAFGIFSIYRRDNTNANSITQFYSQTPHQIRMAKGKFYISIVNENGTSEEQLLSEQLARLILNKINPKVFYFPKIFHDEIYKPYQQNIKYIRGILGLQNGFPEWENLLDRISFSSLYILPIIRKDSKSVVSEIVFSSEKDKSYFYKRSMIAPKRRKGFAEKIVGGVLKVVKEVSSTKIIYMESDVRDKDITRFIKSIENIK